MEIGEDQKELLLSMFNDFTFVDCVKDYAGLDRIMIFKKWKFQSIEINKK